MIDPRADSDEKITPPAPLPFVSRRALKRVKDYMAPPTQCRYCGNPVKVKTHDQLYGRTYSKWPYLYMCICCNAYVGMHPETDLPLGTIANKALREQRKKSKSAFMSLLSATKTSRDAGYTWLAKKMRISKSDCHFGWFEIDQCIQAETICIDAIFSIDCNLRKININSL